MKTIIFPAFTGIRCLMMPYVQGDPDSVPPEFRCGYEEILGTVYAKKGDVGYLTIDESPATKGRPHRGARAQWGRALHTEAGKLLNWGGGTTWGGSPTVTLDRDVKVLLANSVDRSCAIWPVEHEDTSIDGDIGYAANRYPYSEAVLMRAGEVHEISILTPHESLPVAHDVNRQFLRIVGAGVHGREPYFTENPLLKAA